MTPEIEYHVLEELKRINHQLDDLSKCMISMKVSIAKLQVKSGFWGAVGGGVLLLFAVVVKYFIA